MNSKKGRLNKAVNLIELTLVIVIIGILATMALPLFPRAMESTKAKEAVVALHQIRAGERVYRTEENSYWPAGSTEANIGTINDTLRIFLDTRNNRNWDYFVTAAADTFTATATRKGGGSQYSGQTITIDQDGPPFGGSWPLPLP